MPVAYRLIPAGIAALKHLLICLMLAAVVAALVFGLWYPGQWSELAGGLGLFWLIIAVDAVCGPLLTLVIFDPRKPRPELLRDLTLVGLIQLGAMGYGLYSLAQARPVWLAFENDRFRVVSVPDLLPGSLAQAPEALRSLSLTGPQPLGVRVPSGTDPDFLDSVQQAAAGWHPAFRPDHWLPYAEQAALAGQTARPLSELLALHPKQAALIRSAERRSGRELAELGYLPLAVEHPGDWLVLLERSSGEPLDILPLNAWGH
jgi:hypothetical protein